MHRFLGWNLLVEDYIFKWPTWFWPCTEHRRVEPNVIFLCEMRHFCSACFIIEMLDCCYPSNLEQTPVFRCSQIIHALLCDRLSPLFVNPCRTFCVTDKLVSWSSILEHKHRTLWNTNDEKQLLCVTNWTRARSSDWNGTYSIWMCAFPSHFL